MTNIILAAVLSVVVQTNDFHPKICEPYEIVHTNLCGGNAYTLEISPWHYTQFGRERDNPDVKIVEVREIHTLSYQWKGNPYRQEVENKVLSRHELRRKVETKEVWEESDAMLYSPSGTITTTVLTTGLVNKITFTPHGAAVLIERCPNAATLEQLAR